MKIFSLECSTPNAGAALLNDNTVVQSVSWHEERARHEGLFAQSSALINAAGWKWEDIDLFCVGRGPGAYSGLRVSLLAAQALAAPGGKPVAAVSSMDALALQICRRENLDSITIMGDARRQTCWVGHCRADAIPTQPTEWSVISPDELAGALSPTDPIATPHWDAMASVRARYPHYQWIEGVQQPDATHVAKLAWRRYLAGTMPEPLLPLYLHPAV